MTTNLAELMAEDEEGFSLCATPLRERRGRPPADPETRRFNESLWRLVKGKCDVGGIYHELAIVTGLSAEALRSRVADIEWEPEPLPAGTGLDSDDLKYLGKTYGRTSDPSVREFLQKINGGQRKDPDHENARVKRQRITRADGTTKLISLTIDPERN